ncbi:MAG TPA: DNA cytosine methyltransferase [Ktedonobacteraceae bacterium]|jgi:DNA (cytosine-5)-methyltransferase 1
MKERSFKYISLFSGAGGLDPGLEQAGLEPALYLDADHKCCETLRINRPDVPVLNEDLVDLATETILSLANIRGEEVFAVVGGPPCQPFSTGGKRQTVQDRRGNLFSEFLRVVVEAQPLYFLFENVAQIITAAVKHRPIAERPGKNWNLSNYSITDGSSLHSEALPLQEDELSGSLLQLVLAHFRQISYHLTFGVLNAADYGVPQKRLRFVLIGTRLPCELCLPRQTHSSDPHAGLLPWRTLRDAIGDLVESAPLHAHYSPTFQHYFRLIPPGGNWRDLPWDLQRAALGEKAFLAGGGKTGFFRRLAWNNPAPTIVGKPDRKSSALCHPSELRPLTVRESACVQDFPEDWVFAGGMQAQYLQIGNAVPAGLGRAIGHTLVNSYRAYCTSPGGDLRFGENQRNKQELMLTEAKAVLSVAARNKRQKAMPAQAFVQSGLC